MMMIKIKIHENSTNLLIRIKDEFYETDILNSGIDIKLKSIYVVSQQ
jgi:hypothetical protein